MARKQTEINDKSAAELQEHLLDLRREQFNLRMQKGSGQLTQPHQLRRVRRDIARTKFTMGTKNTGKPA
jgi:large subunit ribosomal protein L29